MPDCVYLVNNLSPDGEENSETEQIEGVYLDAAAAFAYARAANAEDVINRRIVEAWSVGDKSRITAISFDTVSFEVQK